MNKVTSCPWFTAAGFKIHVAENNSIWRGGTNNLKAEKFKYTQIKACCDSTALETDRICYLSTA
jgi:hypothetical protein